MAFDELKEQLTEANRTMRSYIDTSKEYYKLKAFKVASQGASGLAKGLIVGFLGGFALFFISLAASWAIGNAMGNVAYGLLIVGGFYTFLAILAFLLRKKLNKPMLRKLSTYYFNEHEN